MKKNRLFKQGLAVLLSLSMSLGPCAPGSFAAFADTAGVSSEVVTSSEVETDAGETGTDTEEEAGAQKEAGSQEEAEVSEEKSEEASGDSASAGDSAGEETSNDDAGESNGGGDEDDPDGGSRDEVSPSGDVNEEDKSESETDRENKGDASAPDQKEENTVPEEADTASETAASEAETEAAPENDETETADASESDEAEVKNSEERHVLQAEVDETMISVIYDDGVFPENVTLEVRKVDEDSAEQEEIREKVEKALKEKETDETISEVCLSAFEIRVLDENGEEVEPDTEKGEMFARFDGISVPDEEDAVFSVDDITVFGLENTAADKVKELEKVEDSEDGELSMAAEGAVVDDVSEEADVVTSENSENDEIIVTVKIRECGFIVLALNKGQVSLERGKLLAAEFDEDPGYWVQSASIASGISWALFSEGVLYIEGTGKLPDAQQHRYFPLDFNVPVKKVIIGDGITYIGRDFFASFPASEYIIPNSVTGIGEMAFVQSNITECIIPNSVTEIGYGAFWESNIEKVVIPGSIADVPVDCFRFCEQLETVTIEEGVERLDGESFYGCNNIKNIVLPSSLRDVYGAFRDCKGLKTVISQGGTYFWDSFSGCSELTDVTILGLSHFWGTFSDCTKLKNIYIAPDPDVWVKNFIVWESTFENCVSLEEITLPDGYESIGKAAFKNCSSLKTIGLPESISEIDDDAFYGCTGLTDVLYAGSRSEWVNITIGSNNENLKNARIHYAKSEYSGVIRSGNDWSMCWECVHPNSSSGTDSSWQLNIFMDGADNSDNWKFSVPEDSSDIEPWIAVSGIDRSEFTKISIQGTGQNPIYIATEQFAGYTGVEEVSLAHIYSFGSGAFKDCVSLEKINGFDDDLVSIGAKAFMNCPKLRTTNYGKYEYEYVTEGDRIFVMKDAANLQSIGESAFEGDINLETLTLCKNVESIGERAFAGCVALTVRCYKNSYAHRYVEGQSINYILLDADERIHVTFKGGIYKTENGLPEMDIPWSLEWFEQNSRAVFDDNHMAIASLVLAANAYDWDLLKKTMQSMGMSDFSHDNYGSYDDINRVGYGIGSTTIDLNGQETNIIIISCRGSSGTFYFSQDWQSNIYQQAQGFDFAAKDLRTDLNTHIQTYNINTEIPTKFLITGHSRGGAVANLLGTRLSDITSDDNVFVYTYASPNTTNEEGRENYSNIKNFIVEGDIVPLIPLMFGGSNKFGHFKILNISTANNFSSSFSLLTGVDKSQLDACSNALAVLLGQDVVVNNCKSDYFPGTRYHAPATYMACLLGYEGEYSYQMQQRFRITSIKCPVDIFVYNNKGILLGTITENQADDSLYETGIFAVVDGDEKYLYTFLGTDLNLKLIGRDDGVMEYSVQDFDESSGDNYEEKIYSNVILFNGKNMTSTVGGATPTETVKLYVVNEEDIPVAEVQENGSEVPVQAATGVSLDRSSLEIMVGGSATLLAEVHPVNASNKKVTWSSSDPLVAEVDQDGKVTGVKTGTATVTAKTVDGGFTADCVVTVKAMDPIEVFIRRLYTTCLSREADAGGLEYWKGRINSGSLKGIGLASEFVFSKEFKSKNYCNEHFVKQIYPALMGREPDAGGLAYWVGQLDSGKMNRESLLNSFTSSAEYKNLCTEAGIELGATMKVPEYGVLPYGPCAVCGDETKVVQFAERMYTVCLGRAAETGGLAYWSKGLYEQTITGKSILENFFLSSEIQGKNLTNREYVRRIYKAMLDRDPDGSGWDYWEGRLNSGASPTAVIAGFIDSKEFTGICEEYGIKRK